MLPDRRFKIYRPTSMWGLTQKVQIYYGLKLLICKVLGTKYLRCGGVLHSHWTTPTESNVLKKTYLQPTVSCSSRGGILSIRITWATPSPSHVAMTSIAATSNSPGGPTGQVPLTSVWPPVLRGAFWSDAQLGRTTGLQSPNAPSSPGARGQGSNSCAYAGSTTKCWPCCMENLEAFVPLHSAPWPPRPSQEVLPLIKGKAQQLHRALEEANGRCSGTNPREKTTRTERWKPDTEITLWIWASQPVCGAWERGNWRVAEYARPK